MHVTPRAAVSLLIVHEQKYADLFTAIDDDVYHNRAMYEIQDKEKKIEVTGCANPHIACNK